MIIGIPSEVKADEYRVALTPAGVRELTSAGHTVCVEKGAGDGSSMPDADFVRTGAKIVDYAEEVWAAADLVCKVKEPVPEEYHRLGAPTRPDALHLPAPRRVDASAPTRSSPPATSAIAYETVRLEDNTLPLLAPMSEVAGRHGPAHGRPPPHAARRGQGRAGVRSSPASARRAW